MVCEFEPHIGLSALSVEPPLGPLSPFLSAPPKSTLVLFLQDQQKQKPQKLQLGGRPSGPMNTHPLSGPAFSASIIS